MTINHELIDNLLRDYKKPEDIIGENGLDSWHIGSTSGPPRLRQIFQRSPNTLKALGTTATIVKHT